MRVPCLRTLTLRGVAPVGTLLLALAAPVAQAAPVQLNFTGVVGSPYQGFVPAVPTGTSIRYQVQFEDRFSDGDYSDWRDPLGPITGWADIGADHYVLDGDAWRFLYSGFFGEHEVSFALTGSGPLTADGDLFEGIFISQSSVTGWHGDGLLGYRRQFPSGALLSATWNSAAPPP